MNAHALLTTQGWLGPGHALDSRLTDYGAPTYKQKGHRGLAYDPNAATTNSSITAGNGLVKPLLVSQRHGSRHGIGKKAHEPASGNQWWLKGFQSALENVGKSESERSSGTSTPQNGLTNGYTGKHSGLYGYFIQGQLMEGTIKEDVSQHDKEQTRRKSKKRKSDVLEDDSATSAPNSNLRDDPLAVAPVKRPQTSKDFESSIPYLLERDKQRRQHRHQRAQSTDLEQFAMIGHYFTVAEGETRKKHKSKSDTVDTKNESETQEDDSERKEIQHARRKQRKEENKQNKKNLTLAEMVEEELARLNSMSNSAAEESFSDTERARRKGERKKKRKKDKDSSKDRTQPF